MGLEDDLYQEILLEHSKRSEKSGKPSHVTCDARGYNPMCGDNIHVFLDVKEGRIHDVGFEGSGCVISKASASMMADAVRGKTIPEAVAIFEQFREMVTNEGTGTCSDLGDLEALSGVKDYPVRIKCATLAWHALKAALAGEKTEVTTE